MKSSNGKKYTDAEYQNADELRKQEVKRLTQYPINRNDKCPCGSTKKAKKCCLFGVTKEST